MTTASVPSDYYTAMVMAASNYSASQVLHPQPGLMYTNTQYTMSQGAPYTAQQSQPHCGYYTQSPMCAAAAATTTTGTIGLSAVMNTSTSSATSSRASHTQAKRYTHNPYASEPSTPTANSVNASYSVNSSLNNSVDGPSMSYNVNAVQPYASEGTTYVDSYPSLTSVTESFYAMVGTIAHAACTNRGRHLLTSVLRMQHLDKIQMIFDEVAPQINTVVLDAHGCHVVRTLAEFLSGEQLATLVAYFEEPTIIAMATSSQHTRRALQTLFERHKSTAFDFIVQVVAADATRLSMTQQGCIAVMRMIEHSMPHQKQHLVAALIPALPTLTMDPYGNYVVQSILQNFDTNVTVGVVCEAYAGHWVPLSCNKFASNVMEKVVRLVSGPARASLVRELVFDTTNLLCLMQDGFGNFVLQAVIDSATDTHEFRSIVEAVRPHLHTSPYGHKIEAKLKGRRNMSRSGSSSSTASAASNH